MKRLRDGDRDGDCYINKKFWFHSQEMKIIRNIASLYRIYAKNAEKRKKRETLKKKVEIFFYICYNIIEEL
jgi:hypothetical protein